MKSRSETLLSNSIRVTILHLKVQMTVYATAMLFCFK